MARSDPNWKGEVVLPALGGHTCRRPNYVYPELRSRTWLAGQVAAGLSDAQIAAEINATLDAVRMARKRHRLGTYNLRPDRTTTARQRIRERLEKGDE